MLQGVVTLPISYLLGLMNEYWGKQWAYQMTLAFCLISILLLTAVYYSQQRYEKQMRATSPKDIELAEISQEKKTDNIQEAKMEDVKEVTEAIIKTDVDTNIDNVNNINVSEKSTN